MSRVVSLDLAAEPYRSAQPVRIQTRGNPCRVPTCEYLAGDAFICPSCVEEWEVHLGNVTVLVEDLEVAQRRQARFGTREGSAIAVGASTNPETRHLHTRHPNHTEPPMPVDLAAGYWLARLGNELVGQIRLICESGHIRVPELDGPVHMSRWLLRQSARLPYLPEQDGWGLVHDLDQVMRDALAAIDAPARRKYVRVCLCGLAVMARPDQDKARCACGREWDVEAEHEARMEVARDAWVTIAEAAEASGVSLGRLKTWVNRGKIDSHGDPRRVRYGDVLDVARDMREKSA